MQTGKFEEYRFDFRLAALASLTNRLVSRFSFLVQAKGVL